MAVHAVGGATLTVIAMCLLRKPLGEATGLATILSFAVYLTALAGVMLSSAIYNWHRPGRRKDILRRIDHAMIYALIAGTYTPFAVRRILQPGPEAAGHPLAALVLVWVVALGGMAMKVAFPLRFERIGLALYLGLGWSMAVLAPSVWTALPWAPLLLVAAGGLLYTVGTAFHLMDRLAYSRAIWHGFVVVAAGCHVTAVALASA
nr:hemolysin III family protein [Azospirillum picis]